MRMSHGRQNAAGNGEYSSSTVTAGSGGGPRFFPKARRDSILRSFLRVGLVDRSVALGPGRETRWGILHAGDIGSRETLQISSSKWEVLSL